jgi:hypothetical protein
VTQLPTDSLCPKQTDSFPDEVFMLIPEAASINNPVLISNHLHDAMPSTTGKYLTKTNALKLMNSLDNAGKHQAILKEVPLMALFFYLIQQPLSVVFIEEWFIESGLNKQAANMLAEFIFWARLDRDDEAMEQLINQMAGVKKMPGILLKQEFMTPTDVTHAFHLSSAPGTFRLYGAFDPLNNRKTITQIILQLDLLNETNHLVEDEAHLLLGLSLSLFTLMVATSGPLPTLNKWLKNHISIAMRTHTSLGHIIESHYADCFDALSQDIDAVNLVSYNQQSGFFQHPLYKNRNIFLHSGSEPTGLPLFLLLNKHPFTR